jgi:hypothetical protein
MNNYVEIQQKVDDLSHKVSKLLDDISNQKTDITCEQVDDLEYYSGELGRLAYGNNRPEFLNTESYNLISWCDHTHEEEILNSFMIAVKSRPLIQPPWSGGN